MSKTYAVNKVLGAIKQGMEVYRSNEYNMLIVDENTIEFVVRIRDKVTREVTRYITVDKYKEGYKRNILYILGNDKHMDLIAGWPGDMEAQTVTPLSHPNLFPIEAVVKANASATKSETVVLNAAKITSSKPTLYRLFKPARGPVVLQGLFEWSSSTEYGADWKDIPTVVEQPTAPVTFEEALRAKCPTCGALPGTMCVHIRGEFIGQVCSTTHNMRLKVSI